MAPSKTYADNNGNDNYLMIIGDVCGNNTYVLSDMNLYANDNCVNHNEIHLCLCV